jgi:uncharacterized protein YjbJ (UPF0337 family)
MDENHISGTARNVAGKVEEGLGRAAGDASSEFKGKLDEAAGAAQDPFGQTADAARQTAITFDKWLRKTIETQPYTSAFNGAVSPKGASGIAQFMPQLPP